MNSDHSDIDRLSCTHLFKESLLAAAAHTMGQHHTSRVLTGSPVRDLFDDNSPADKSLWHCASGLLVMEIPIARLTWLLDVPYFWETDRDKPCSVTYVLQHPQFATLHMRRIRQADLTYPLLIARCLDGRYDVLDGLHRLAAAVQAQHSTVKVQVLTEERVQTYFIKYPKGALS